MANHPHRSYVLYDSPRHDIVDVVERVIKDPYLYDLEERFDDSLAGMRRVHFVLINIIGDWDGQPDKKT